MDYQENIFRYKNILIKYYERGLGEPILFLQGGGVSLNPYKKILVELSEKYHVIAPTLPFFYSLAVPKETWGFDEYGDFFSKFIKFLNLKELSVIGHSLGGGVALNLASKNKEIKNLIVVDSAGKSCGLSERRFRFNFLVKRNLYNLLHYGKPWQALKGANEFFKIMIKNITDWPHIEDTLRKCLFGDIGELSKIKIPTLILWGEKDELFSSSLAEIINKEIPTSILKFVKGNHEWCFFRQNELVSLVDQWLEMKTLSVQKS
ncbi:MAG: alpha/beta hydrolase [Parcubacteria group bacterium]